MNTNKKKTNKKLLYTLAMVFFAMPSLRAMENFGDHSTSQPVDLVKLLYVLSLLQQNNLINTTQPVLAPQISQSQQNNLINTAQPAPTNLLQQNNISFAFNGPTNIVLSQVPLIQPEFSRFSTTNTPQAYNTQNSQPLNLLQQEKNTEKSHFLKCDYSKIWPDQEITSNQLIDSPMGEEEFKNSQSLSLDLDYSEFCIPQPDQQIISNQLIDNPKKRTFPQFSTTNTTNTLENPLYKIRGLNAQQNGVVGSTLFRVPSNQNTKEVIKEVIDLTTSTEENNVTQQSTSEPTNSEKEEFDKASSNFKLHIGASYRHFILKPYFTSNIERPDYIIQLFSLCKKPAMTIKFLSYTEPNSGCTLFDYAVTYRSIDFLEKIINYITRRVKRSQDLSCMNTNSYKPFIELIEKGAVLATKKNRAGMAAFLNKKADALKKMAPSINYLTQAYDTRPVLIPQKTSYKSVPDAIKEWVLSKPTSPFVLRDPLNLSNTLNASKSIEELVKPAAMLNYLTAFEFAVAEGTVEALTLLLKMVTDLLISPDLTNRPHYYSIVITELNKSMFLVQDEARKKVLSDAISQLATASKN